MEQFKHICTVIKTTQYPLYELCKYVNHRLTRIRGYRPSRQWIIILWSQLLLVKTTIIIRQTYIWHATHITYSYISMANYMSSWPLAIIGQPQAVLRGCQWFDCSFYSGNLYQKVHDVLYCAMVVLLDDFCLLE